MGIIQHFFNSSKGSVTMWVAEQFLFQENEKPYLIHLYLEDTVSYGSHHLFYSVFPEIKKVILYTDSFSMKSVNQQNTGSLGLITDRL
jgi:hypothetical protein